MPLSLEFVWKEKKTIIDSMPTFQIKYAWAFWRINHPSNKARAEVEGVEGVGEQYNNVNNNPSFLTLLPTYSEPYPKCCIY